MKKRYLLIIIISIVLVLLIAISLKIAYKPNTKKEKKQTPEEIINKAIKNFENSNYTCEINYSVEDSSLPNVNYKRIMYKYKNYLEEYYTENFTYEYDNYKEKIVYQKNADNYSKKRLNYDMNKDIILKLFKNATFNKEEKPVYLLNVKQDAAKEFVNSFTKRDKTVLPIQEDREYYVLLRVKNKHIFWFSLMQKDDTKNNITYSFNNINTISDIEIPKEFKDNALLKDMEE